MNQNIVNKKTTFVILFGVAMVAALGVNAFSTTSSVSEADNETTNVEIRAVPPYPVPASEPILLEQFGTKFTSFDEAKQFVGMTNAVLPSYIPGGIQLDSIRTQVNEAGNEITAIYVPQNTISTIEKSGHIPTYENVISDGMTVNIKANAGPSSDWEDIVNFRVKEAPDVRSSTTIGNVKAMLIKGTPEYGWPSQARIVYDDQYIMLSSLKHDTVELEKVLRSMIEK